MPFCAAIAMLTIAYLDPGSGSALLGTVFALVGAAAYSLKSVFYRLLGKKQAKVEAHEGIALFSEGRSYWGTFRPLVEELLRRGVAFSYYTLDVDDPALTIDSPLMYARLFDKTGVTWTRKFAGVRARVLLSTTPNIGCKGYPLPRPKGVGRLVHVFHDPLGDVSTYARGSLDYYDEVLLAGPAGEAPIRELERKRGLPRKELVAAGVPYLDVYAAERQRHPGGTGGGRPCVMVASSWGGKGLLRTHGHGFVRDLLAAGFRVVVRPHPHSYQAERAFIEKVEREVVGWGAEWDRDPNGVASMAKVDVMVSDSSGVRFDFAYLFGRPVVSLRGRQESSEGFESADLEGSWTGSAAAEIGQEVDGAEGVVEAVRGLLSRRAAAEEAAAWRDAHCVHFGHAAAAVVDRLVELEGRN